MLNSSISPVNFSPIQEWEHDLSVSSEEQLQNLYHLTYSSSINYKTQENNDKVLKWWYRVPSTLALIYILMSDCCWRGCGPFGKFLHAWNALLMLFWADIKAQIELRKIWDIDLAFHSCTSCSMSPLSHLVTIGAVFFHTCLTQLNSPYLLIGRQPQ